jgi:hypothetical protein
MNIKLNGAQIDKTETQIDAIMRVAAQINTN